MTKDSLNICAMGCTVSTIEHSIHSKTGRYSESRDHVPQLSDAEIVIIQNNWQSLKLHVANIGVKTYSSMFENRPELIKTFSKFKGKDLYTLQESGLLQQHALRVMATIDKCITCINQPSDMVHLLREVGHHHILYNVQADDIQMILPHFLGAMKSYIQSNWSDDLEDVWIKFLTIVFYHMREGIQEELNLQEIQQRKEYVQDTLKKE